MHRCAAHGKNNGSGIACGVFVCEDTEVLGARIQLWDNATGENKNGSFFFIFAWDVGLTALALEHSH